MAPSLLPTLLLVSMTCSPASPVGQDGPLDAAQVRLQGPWLDPMLVS